MITKKVYDFLTRCIVVTINVVRRLLNRIEIKREGGMV
ncbi:hypothetical protein bwei_5783 [Bacillus mycoides]|uniref:Uncharacterized protein n=1 Tax=Bacillus cereus VD021 TaxID=1053224 RepID=R8HFG6_BACCE|nr:hypothetical protein bwei_5783 [Bacillus mycoides]EOO71521.1 hypothetical protein IIC_04381 [Bacillus cereus VD021]